MLHVIAKYRLLLIALLISLGGQVSAHMQFSYGHGSITNQELLVIKAAQSAHDQEWSKIDLAEKEVEEDEVEDDDVNFSRKHFDSNYTGIFLTPIFGYSVICIKSIFLYSDHPISETATQKYLLFEVFRI